MRRSINLGWVLVLCLCMKGWGQQPYLGTKTPYVLPHVSYTPPPAGYQPVFINYVGRHGARFLTKAGADQHVLEVLTAAEKDNALTEMGEKVRVIAQRLQAAGKGNYENITLLGKEEQEAIGERMRYQYASVFAGKGVTPFALKFGQTYNDPQGPWLVLLRDAVFGDPGKIDADNDAINNSLKP